MRKITVNLILTVLLSSVLISLMLNVVKAYPLNIRFFIGSGGILTVILLRLVSEKYSNYGLGIVLLAGSFNWVTFSHIDFRIEFFLFGDNSLNFNLIVFSLFIFYIAANGQGIREFLVKEEESSEENEEDRERNINVYEQRFTRKSIDELKEIISNPGIYTEAAIKAAERMLAAKNNSPDGSS